MTSFIVTALVTEEGNLALLMSDDRVIVAGRVIGPDGEKGDRGMPGVRGPAGRDGNTILTVDGMPQASDGVEGDWAINKRDHLLYGPKTSAGWGKGNPMTVTAASLDAAIKQFNSKGGPGNGRFFGMGAPSTPGGAIAATSGAGLDQILNYGNSLPTINSPLLVAVDQSGDAMMVDVWGRSATGTSFVEVAAAKGAGTDSGHSTVFDVQMGANPPTLSFSTAVVPGLTPGDPPQLQVYLQSNQPLLEVRGRIVKL